MMWLDITGLEKALPSPWQFVKDDRRLTVTARHPCGLWVEFSAMCVDELGDAEARAISAALIAAAEAGATGGHTIEATRDYAADLTEVSLRPVAPVAEESK